MNPKGRNFNLLSLKEYLFFILVLFLGLPYGASEVNAQSKQQFSVHVSGLGARTDESFYQSMYKGYLDIKTKYPKIKVGFTDLIPFAEGVSHLDTLGSAGVDLVITELGLFEASVQVAPKYPNTWFMVMNLMPEMMGKLPSNITANSWRDEQDGYLAGVVAGAMTKSNKLGVVMGFDYPDMVKLAAGFLLGARSVNPTVKLSVIYTGSWTDVQKAYDAAKVLISSGVDVIMHHTNAGGDGLREACKEAKVWVIGEVLDQSHLLPELTLTSMLNNHPKMFEVAVEDLIARRLKKQVRFFGAQEGEKLLAPLNPKVPKEVREKVEGAQQKIASGELVVPVIQDSKKFDEMWK